MSIYSTFNFFIQKTLEFIPDAENPDSSSYTRPILTALATITALGTAYYLYHLPSKIDGSKIAEALLSELAVTQADDERPIVATYACGPSKIDGSKIAEALLSELAVTQADDERPIVATYACGPCVAVGGYDSINKIAFVVHFANEGAVRESGHLIFYNISKLVKVPISTPIQLHLRGGYEGASEATIKAIKIWMEQREDLPMVIASEDILASYKKVESISERSLLIDSRTGKVSEYNCQANPEHRDFSELDRMVAMANNNNIILAYSPNQ